MVTDWEANRTTVVCDTMEGRSQIKRAPSLPRSLSYQLSIYLIYYLSI